MRIGAFTRNSCRPAYIRNSVPDYNFHMLSRRSLFSFAAKGAAVITLANIPAYNTFAAESAAPAPLPFGRVAVWGYALREQPSFNATIVKWFQYDQVIPLLEQVTGDPLGTHKNAVWFRTEGGFVHSAWMQPVDNHPNDVLSKDAATAKFWSEVSVPFTEARYSPGSRYYSHRLYYGTVYHVIDVVQDETGASWYRVAEGVDGGGFVKAEHLKPIKPEDMAPISPNAENKRIEVDLPTSILTAYEGDTAVFAAPFASGTRKKGQYTPGGSHRVLYKAPTAHMSGDIGTEDGYDLPGVAFCSFFTAQGVAIHGTYWHYDWGARRSHGCVNVSNDTARWVWRWSNPIAPYESAWYFPKVWNSGTLVNVNY